MAFQLSDLVQAIEADASFSLENLKVDGGAAANDFLLQFQSDILNKGILRPPNSEATALGAAFLAGLSCGLWQNKAELQALLYASGHETFSPHMTEEQRKNHVRNWRKAVNRVL
jgi:glycerol kinase